MPDYRVLVVDDNPSMRKRPGMVLKQIGGIQADFAGREAMPETKDWGCAMPTKSTENAKKSELWIAAGGDRLTSVVTINHDNTMAATCQIVIAGTAGNDNAYISSVITAATTSDTLRHVTIDVGEMVFINGLDINPYAIECLLEIIISVVNRGGKVEILSPCPCVGEALTDVFGRQEALRHAVTIKTVFSPGLGSPTFGTPAPINKSEIPSMT